MQIDERGDEPDEAGVVARHAVLPMLRGPTKKEVVVVPGRARLLDDALEDGREGHGGHRADEEVRGHDVSVDHGRDDECARAEGGGEGEERQEGGHDGGGGCSGVGDVGEGEGFPMLRRLVHDVFEAGKHEAVGLLLGRASRVEEVGGRRGGWSIKSFFGRGEASYMGHLFRRASGGRRRYVKLWYL